MTPAAPGVPRAHRRCWWCGRILIAALLLAAPAAAEEPALEFLRAAQDRGYGEIAIDYLEQLRASGRMPKELQETYDLELSRSYRVAVAEAFNAAEAETRMAKSQSHLDKFLKEHPDHPEVARAMESWGDLGLDQGLERLRQAAGTKDTAQKEKYLAAARAAFAEAKPRFVDATKRYLERYEQLKKSSADKGRRPRTAATASRKQRKSDEALRDAELSWLECRFKDAKTGFYTGQSYANRNAPERKAAFEAAAKAFDDVFQSYRESLVGLHAHLWQGRSVDELGKDQLALDIYDEVLSIAPDGRERETGLEPLFAQAQYYRLLVLKRIDGAAAFLAEAEPWLEQRRAWRRFDGYQGVMLEVARANLDRAGTLTGSQKTSLVQSSLAMLADIARVRGEHQQEAILLRRQSTQAGAAPTADPASAKTFDEALALGEAALENLDWAGAVTMFNRALELKSSATDEKRLAETAGRLDQARYQMAVAQYSAGKYDECLAAAEQVMRDRPAGPMAPPAASLAVSAALSLYARAQDKQPAFERLDAIAQEMIRRWPDKAEADDARIALGQASLVRGEYAAAAAAFEAVNPRSLRYPTAMFLAGQTNWRLYLSAKKKLGGDPAALDARRDRAQQQLQTSLDQQRKAAESNPAAAGSQLTDTQLLLAELELDAGRTEEAAQLVRPLADAVLNEKPKPLDTTHLRVLLATARAEGALGQFDKVVTFARLITELGDDNMMNNGVLNTLFKLLVDAWKQAEADAIEARTAADAARRTAAEAAIVKRKKLVGDLVPPLSKRKENSLAARIFIADMAAELGQTDTARDLYQIILAQGDDDPAFKRTNGPALTRIQAQLVGLLRQKGQYEEALAEVNKLIADYPTALEPLMEKGRVLQGWAEVDPARFDDAVAHWTMLRTRLSRVARKPPEYYEVVYNAASCLFADSLKANDPKKALQAEQLLNATLILSPKLDGPEMVARYKDLLHKSRQLQGRPASAATSR